LTIARAFATVITSTQKRESIVENLTRGDLISIEYFIDFTLGRQWEDVPFQHMLQSTNYEDCKRSMNPKMYEMMLKIRGILKNSES
jgi:hypothetical protein